MDAAIRDQLQSRYVRFAEEQAARDLRTQLATESPDAPARVNRNQCKEESWVF